MIQLVERNCWKFAQRSEKPYVAAVIGVTATDEVLFVKQWRESVQKQVLDIPSGVVELDEHPYDAAKREFLEETGYEPKGQLEFLGRFTTSPGIVNETLWLYVCKCKFVTNKIGVDDEKIELVKFPIDTIGSCIWTMHNYSDVAIDLKAYLASIYVPNYRG
jgi:ADP-ribose pyrophosphatase